MNHRIAGIVLAAGRSSRMGSPKGLLDLSGRTFVDAVMEALRAGGCDPVVVVVGPRSLPGAEEIARRAVEAGAIVAINSDPASEQIESLRIGVRALMGQATGVVVTPVDSPRIEPSTVARLIAAAGGGAPVAVPVVDGRRGHPILFAGDALAAVFEELPEGARTLIRRHRDELVEVHVDSRDVLLDVDTPEDYRRLTETSS